MTIISPMSGMWRRQLAHYPETRRRTVYLAIIVLATVVLYYELYVQGAVATQIIAHFHMTLRYYIYIAVVGNLLGAFASLAAGLADRWGRANFVAFGLVATGLLVALGLPNAGSKAAYLVMFALVSVVEGMVLVATPALVRDFSPQLGRASAMGFWTLGPVIGSLVVTEVSSHTLASHPGWQFQFRVCGAVGLVVALVAMIGLRELAPGLRDQLMVSLKDRTLVEAKAAGLDTEAARKGHWRQMMHLDVIGSGFAISAFLLFYYIAVGFFVVYYATTFGYSEARANSLANWYWISNAIALVVTGALSDRIKVRKPFMVVGGVISAVGVALFAAAATHPDTGYYHLAVLLVVISAGGGIAYCAWMASFTETVERHNPAGTASGLAVWGWTIRMVVTVSLIGLTLVVSGANLLVNQGPRVALLAAQYKAQLATVAKLSPATLAALTSNPTSPATQALAISELSGDPVATVAQIAGIAARFPGQVATLQTVDTTTLETLSLDPTSHAAIATAVRELTTRFGIGVAAAEARLAALQAVPRSDAETLVLEGGPVSSAAAQLTALSRVPAADLAFLQKYGTKVAHAQRTSPRQWRTWWWICFVGQLLFLPFVFVMAGRWSPRRAREDAQAHDAAVTRELAAMTSGLLPQARASVGESRSETPSMVAIPTASVADPDVRTDTT